MKILLTGASGFIGGHLRQALHARGHAVRLGGRSRPATLADGEEWVSIDLAQWRDGAAGWPGLLGGVDVVVNTVGILRERAGQSFADLHVEGPRALFDAAARAGVARGVHLSALGADADAESAYHLSKRAGDEAVLAVPIAVAVAQPSLVFGPGGASARLFAMLAAMPVVPLPAGGHQPVQPIHIDDLVEALVALATSAEARRGRVALVGPEPIALRDWLAALRRSMRLAPAWRIALPAWAMAAAASMGRWLPSSPLDRDTWNMLQRGNVAPAADTRALLGRSPRPVQAFVPAEHANAVRRSAQLDFFMPLLRVAIAAVWIVTGIVSLGVYPVAESYALLRRTGVEGALAPWALYGAALLDLGLGLATLLLPRRRWLWLGQIALILGYTAIISVRLPEFWIHPYGPLLKNLPMLAALWMLYAMDREPMR